MKDNGKVSERKNVLWAGRLAEKPTDDAFAFQASITVDSRMAREDIQGSRAHVKMLGKQGILDTDSAAAIENELVKIAAELEKGSLVIDTSCEDIHSFVEGLLTERLGDAGRAVHAGRSRNDQVAVDTRLYLKRRTAELTAQLDTTINIVLDRAQEYIESLMPGYTHLQRAQPVTLGYHLSAWVCALRRDEGRFYDAERRLDLCPLGSGALAGTTLNLDRNAVAQELGFSGITINSMDAVADRDFAVELAAACAITQTHLSRFCEDIALWASEEFKFIDLAEAWSTGSSIMPQKKNPDFAELIRGKTGRTTGNLVTLLTLLKGLPYAYNKDLQEDKEALFDSLDTVENCLRMFGAMIKTARFRTERMAAACEGGFLEATDAAEYLVKKGLPFRKAHEAAALLVRDAIEAGFARLSELAIEQFKRRSLLFENDIYAALSPAAAVKGRSLPGGPAPDEVRRQIQILRTVIKK